MRDQPRAAVGLARPRRPLDDEVRALEPVEQRALLRELTALQRARRRAAARAAAAARDAGSAPSPASSDAANRRSAALLRLRADRAAGDERGRQRRVAQIACSGGAGTYAGRVVDRRDGPAGPVLTRVVRLRRPRRTGAAAAGS